jgi:NADPH:quinone reductase-like Zn-dependent oxidoreductase
MRAIVLDDLGGTPRLVDDLPDPTPGTGEVLVRVAASSVNPVDNAIAAGMLKDMAEHVLPITLGRDFAGTVEAVGSDVTTWSPGDQVYGVVATFPRVHDGSWAELIVVPESGAIARTPAGVNIAAAGAATVAGFAALVAFDALAVSEGDTLLVIGATGGVGSLVVQLAAQAGATVIAPSLPEDELYLTGLGASEVIARDGSVVDDVRSRHPDGVDALLDNVSYAPGAFDGALKDGGRVASPNNAAGEGPGRTNVMGLPTPELFARLSDLLASGALKIPIQEVYALDKAPEAMHALSAQHTRGKLAIRVP